MNVVLMPGRNFIMRMTVVLRLLPLMLESWHRQATILHSHSHITRLNGNKKTKK
jgi:hypothetical protein